MKIEDKLATLNHLESSIISPRTSKYIEYNREAIETIRDLRKEPIRFFTFGFISGITIFVILYLILKSILG